MLTRSLRGSSALSLLKYFWSFILMWRGRRGLEKERKTHKWKCYHHQHHCVQKCGPQEWVPIKSGVRGREWGGHQEGTKSCFSSPSFIPPFDSFHNFSFTTITDVSVLLSADFKNKEKNNWSGRIFPPIYFGRNVGFPYINLYVLTQSIKSVKPVWCVSNWIERNRVEERKDGNLEYEEELLLFSYHIISVSTKVTLNFTDPSNFAKLA